MGKLTAEVFNPSCCDGDEPGSCDSRELAAKHHEEHKESAWVPQNKMGLSHPNRILSDVSAPHVGIGGAPTRASTLPTDPAERKQYPVASGVLDYFPDAIVALSHLSWRGNEQHNPGQPLHWARSKSSDEADTMQRHFLQRGTLDDDGVRHTAKMAWRALALLQKEIEHEPRSS
jgi:hypothetical protein